MKPHLLSLLTVVQLLTLPPAGAQTDRSPDLLDPGFNVIDATLLRAAGKYHLFIKDERKNPLKKNLRHAMADAPAGHRYGSILLVTADELRKLRDWPSQSELP